MAWNESQSKAINSTGNVLVSAGAGSGKTSVLTQRVIKQIIEDKYSINDFLIVTFTNAAAKEMKERIKKALLKNKLDNLVNLVDSAHIETFDAYALFIVKKYGYYLNLPHEINNVPEDVIKIKIHNIVDEIFAKFYEEKNETFSNLIETYSFNNDSLLISFIIDLYVMYKNLNNKEEFIDTYKEKFLLTSEMLSKVDKMFIEIKMNIDLIKDFVGRYSLSKFVDAFNDYFHELYEASDFQSFYNAYSDLDNKKTPQLKGASIDDKGIKGSIDTLLKRLDYYCTFSLETYKNVDIPNAQKFIPFILDILKTIDKELFEFEVSCGYFTFADVANFASELVRNYSAVREDIKSTVKLILIDEYQDTSNLQNEFINLISNNNVFAVGDVKQSIYLFRGANPYNFMKIYGEYKTKKQAIDMNVNYRSREEVVAKVNEIFDRIMTEKFGGADYSISHILTSGNLEYENEGKVDGQHGIVSMYYEDNEDPILRVIDDIKKRLAYGEKIYDRETKQVREVTYKDFAILSPKGNNFIDYEKIIEDARLPVNAVYDEPLLEDNSIMVLSSILKLISFFIKGDNSNETMTTFRSSYISVLRSYLCEYSDEEIYNLFKNNNYQNDKVYLKVKVFSENHKTSSLYDIYFDAVKDFDLIYKSIRNINPMSLNDKTKLFYDRIKVMDDLNYTLDDFINYLADLSDNKINMESRHNDESTNTITLTTIHKSKGLEYKIVYLIGMDAGTKNDTRNYLVDKNEGAWLPCFAFDDCKPIELLLHDANDSKFKEETMRKLYVALTRAEDTCILVRKKNDNPLAPNVELCTTIGGFIDASEVHFDINEYCDLESKDYSLPNAIKESNDKFTFKELKVDLTKSNSKHNASKALDLDVDIAKLNYGTHMHLLMEEVDLLNKDTSFIKDELEAKRINKVLHNALFDNLEGVDIYKEYQFIDTKNNHSGTIDLLFIYKDKAVIIDYKLKHIDDEAYKTQLKVYKDFVEDTFKLTAKCYLLSLIDDEVKEVY